MIAGEVFITPHAVKQFRARVPGCAALSYEQALERIIHALQVDVRSIRPTAKGTGICARVRGALNFRAVIVAGDDKPAVVTILRSGA